jgi:hypothetical protein
MLTSFATIPANGCSSPSSPDANASPSGTNLPAKENPMLIDPQIMMNDQVIKVTVLMTGTGLLNPIPYATGFVQHLTMADPSALLLSVGRSDMHEGQTFEEPHTYVMKHQSNATSKSQAQARNKILSHFYRIIY